MKRTIFAFVVIVLLSTSACFQQEPKKSTIYLVDWDAPQVHEIWVGLERFNEGFTRDNWRAVLVDPEDLAGGDHVKLVIGHGSQASQVLQAARNNPGQRYLLLDYDGEVPGNVIAVQFREEEKAFMAGIIAALTSRTGTVGIAVSQASEYGFLAGVALANTQITVLVVPPGVGSGREAAYRLAEEGADVLYTTYLPWAEAFAAEALLHDLWLIGSAWGHKDFAPYNTLTVVANDLAEAGLLVNRQLKEDRLTGNLSLGLAQDCLTFLPLTSASITSFLEEQILAVKSGMLKVPVNQEEFEEFMASH
jgi:basic membrane protein A